MRAPPADTDQARATVKAVTERIDQLLHSDAFAQHLGIERASAEQGMLAVAMTIGPEHQNFLGVTHGGALFSLADCAFALASNLAGDRAVAIDTHLVITGSSALGDRLVAVAEEVTRGRTLGTYRITVTRQNERVVGLFTGTVHISSES